MEKMGKEQKTNQRGITLIELLVALVICGFVVAGIYRLFVAQTRAYTVQDQVVEVQQGIRSAMEILLRDLRMAGFDSDSITSKISIANPILVGDHSVTVSYEYDDTHRHEITYSLINGSLSRQLTIFPDVGPSSTTTENILENVDTLNFTYGVDINDDRALDSWISAGGGLTSRVVAVRVVLIARPDQTNLDVQKMINPRRLESIVTLRNLCMAK
jgi:type IV pilus assembly protein PilW